MFIPIVARRIAISHIIRVAPKEVPKELVDSLNQLGKVGRGNKFVRDLLQDLVDQSLGLPRNENLFNWASAAQFATHRYFTRTSVAKVEEYLGYMKI